MENITEDNYASDDSVYFSKILLFFKLLNDIIHLHIYPLILFMIVKNIDSHHFGKFINNIILIILSNISGIYILSDYFLDGNNNQITISLRVINYIKYSLIVEFLAYTYHRLVHIKLLYNVIHTHDYPYDYLLCSKVDIIARSTYMFLPLALVPVTYTDFMIIYYIYVFIGFLSDANRTLRIHRYTKKYNYSLGLPIFDYIFGTYLSRDNYTSLTHRQE